MGFELLSQRQVNLRQIYFIITRKCNLSCSHCIRDSGPRIKDRLTLEDAKIVLEKLAPYGQEALLLITGGEPAIHPDATPIVQLAAGLFKKVMINTNGLPALRLLEMTDVAPGVRLQISLDGDTASHQAIRGKDTFAPTLRNIRRLSNSGAIVTVATTVSSANLNSLKALDAALSDIPFSLWTLKRQVSYNRGDGESQKVTTPAWNDLVTRIYSGFENRHRVAIQPMFSLESFRSAEDSQIIDERKLNCGTGRSKLYVNPDLTVFPCACLEELHLGDLRTDSVHDILERMRALPIEPKPDSPCNYCPAKRKCMGGCPGASLRAYGSFGVGDPRCMAISDLLG